ncbi:MAG: hypothetical protein DRP68_04950 [Candidatus Omnitrophota bacterium]|nr:MAG: hypothetical protein DRP68_04950 [Candidatus Omnitrophota bacterium]RKY45723.1 MAG: hypothetical protein DRP81_03030 [Candidatus Omnitrophota bacterium]HDN86437.1 hypothetical protein [Candidatus Omnitrophota bacterium]
MRIKIIVVILITLGGLIFLIRKGLASYSNQPSSNVGVCYEENWEATQYYVLKQEGTNFKYEEKSQPTLGVFQVLNDVVVTKWEVTGSLKYAKE